MFCSLHFSLFSSPIPFLLRVNDDRCGEGKDMREGMEGCREDKGRDMDGRETKICERWQCKEKFSTLSFPTPLLGKEMIV
jgi:hypothetical protein